MVSVLLQYDSIVNLMNAGWGCDDDVSRIQSAERFEYYTIPLSSVLKQLLAD